MKEDKITCPHRLQLSLGQDKPTVAYINLINDLQTDRLQCYRQTDNLRVLTNRLTDKKTDRTCSTMTVIQIINSPTLLLYYYCSYYYYYYYYCSIIIIITTAIIIITTPIIITTRQVNMEHDLQKNIYVPIQNQYLSVFCQFYIGYLGNKNSSSKII